MAVIGQSQLSLRSRVTNYSYHSYTIVRIVPIVVDHIQSLSFHRYAPTWEIAIPDFGRTRTF